MTSKRKMRVELSILTGLLVWHSGLPKEADGSGGGVVSQRSSAGPEIVYRVDLTRRARNRARVTMRVPGFAGRLTVAMPAWTPGAYRLEFWAKNVFPLGGQCGGRKLLWRRLDRSRWAIVPAASGGPGGPCVAELNYEVYARSLTDNGSHIDLSHAYINGPSLFVYVEGQRNRRARVELKVPSGWSAHAPHAKVGSAGNTAVFVAPSYDALVDGPIEVGAPAKMQIRVGRSQVTVLLCGSRASLPRRLAKDLKRVFEWQAKMMGGLPFRRYLALIQQS